MSFEEKVEGCMKTMSNYIEFRMPRQLKSRISSEDIVQEVLMNASRRYESFLSKKNIDFKYWIMKIAKQRIIDLYRKHVVSLKRSTERESIYGTVVDYEKPLDVQIQDNELRENILEAIALLKPSHKEILKIRYEYGMDLADSAKELNITIPSAGMRYNRALKALKEIIESTPDIGSKLNA